MEPYVFTSSSNRPSELTRALAENGFLVVGLCAAWCGTCAGFARDFDGLAAARRDATFAWVDIEDDADLAGDIDVENFPTIAIYRRGRLVHFGVSLPQVAIIGRLLDALGDDSATVPADAAVVALPTGLASDWAG